MNTDEHRCLQDRFLHDPYWQGIYQTRRHLVAGAISPFVVTRDSFAAARYALQAMGKADCPPIVCLCGSGRFREAFDRAEFEETLAGKIVLTIGCNAHDVARSADLAHHKPMLDELHLRKIDLADEVLVLNVGGYIGESTARELAYAREHGKPVRFLEPEERRERHEICKTCTRLGRCPGAPHDDADAVAAIAAHGCYGRRMSGEAKP